MTLLLPAVAEFSHLSSPRLQESVLQAPLVASISGFLRLPDHFLPVGLSDSSLFFLSCWNLSFCPALSKRCSISLFPSLLFLCLSSVIILRFSLASCHILPVFFFFFLSALPPHFLTFFFLIDHDRPQKHECLCCRVTHSHSYSKLTPTRRQIFLALPLETGCQGCQCLADRGQVPGTELPEWPQCTTGLYPRSQSHCSSGLRLHPPKPCFWEARLN